MLLILSELYSRQNIFITHVLLTNILRRPASPIFRLACRKKTLERNSSWEILFSAVNKIDTLASYWNFYFCEAVDEFLISEMYSSMCRITVKCKFDLSAPDVLGTVLMCFLARSLHSDKDFTDFRTSRFALCVKACLSQETSNTSSEKCCFNGKSMRYLRKHKNNCQFKQSTTLNVFILAQFKKSADSSRRKCFWRILQSFPSLIRPVKFHTWIGAVYTFD